MSWFELVVGLVKVVCVRPSSMLWMKSLEWCALSAQKDPAKSLHSKPLSQRIALQWLSAVQRSLSSVAFSALLSCTSSQRCSLAPFASPRRLHQFLIIKCCAIPLSAIVHILESDWWLLKFSIFGLILTFLTFGGSFFGFLVSIRPHFDSLESKIGSALNLA